MSESEKRAARCACDLIAHSAGMRKEKRVLFNPLRGKRRVRLSLCMEAAGV